MTTRALTNKLRRAIAKKKMELEVGKVPECGYVVVVDKFDESLPEFVYQITRASLPDV